MGQENLNCAEFLADVLASPIRCGLCQIQTCERDQDTSTLGPNNLASIALIGRKGPKDIELVGRDRKRALSTNQAIRANNEATKITTNAPIGPKRSPHVAASLISPPPMPGF